jgi:hypothetical protein
LIKKINQGLPKGRLFFVYTLYLAIQTLKWKKKMKQPKFQSREDYERDYDWYKRGYQYVVIHEKHGVNIHTPFIRHALWERIGYMGELGRCIVGIIDLKAKFKYLETT